MDQQQRHPIIANADVYESDFYAWCLATAALVRTGRWEAIDPEALAEELEGLARSQTHELASRLEVLVMHLLKWVYQPQLRWGSHSWADTILEQRNQLARLLLANPSLRRQVPTILTDVYPGARKRAAIAMGRVAWIQQMQTTAPERPSTLDPREAVRLSLLPMTCPWTEAQVL